LKKLNTNPCSFKALKKIIIIPSFLISVNLFAQRPATGTWLNVQFPVQLNNKWQIPNDFNYRTLGNSASALQQLYRGGIKYIFDKHWSATAGIAFAFTRTTFTKQTKEFAREFRYWQEVNYKTQLTANLLGQLRLRVEERSFTATNSKAAYHAFRYRIRPQLQQKIYGKWSLFVADEYMEQHAKNKWSFDQNRFMINGIYSFNKYTQLFAGYMWLQWPANSSQHIITVAFQKTILLHAKQ